MKKIFTRKNENLHYYYYGLKEFIYIHKDKFIFTEIKKKNESPLRINR